MPSAHSSTASDEQTLSHYALRLLKQNGGSVPLLRVVRGAADVGLEPDTARNVIDSHSSTTATFSVERNNDGEQVITHVSPTGSCPDIVKQQFGADATDSPDIISLDAVDNPLASALDALGYTTADELATADIDPDTLTDEINDTLNENAQPIDLASYPGLTDSQANAIEAIGITTAREFVTTAPETIVEKTNTTLTEGAVTTAQQRVSPTDPIYAVDEIKPIITQAKQTLPTAPTVVADSMDTYRARKEALGEAAADITEITADTGSVGPPLADTYDTVSPADISSDVVYTSDIGPNADSPVLTGMKVCKDIGYELVPKPETHPQADHAALPVDDTGEVVPPAVPTEPELQLPIDELIAKKLGRNVPVRLIGPRGAGKNYLLKYLCYKTNRGYRSIDVDKATMPQDLFGPITPSEDGTLEPRAGPIKQGLLNGDVIVINEFPVMKAGAAIALHQYLNENRLVIKSHGEIIDPHPLARIVITVNRLGVKPRGLSVDSRSNCVMQ